jgi:hypothetical protein
MTSRDLSGRTAIVTGASRGIGLAAARALVCAGAAETGSPQLGKSVGPLLGWVTSIRLEEEAHDVE